MTGRSRRRPKSHRLSSKSSTFSHPTRSVQTHTRPSRYELESYQTQSTLTPTLSPAEENVVVCNSVRIFVCRLQSFRRVGVRSCKICPLSSPNNVNECLLSLNMRIYMCGQHIHILMQRRSFNFRPYSYSVLFIFSSALSSYI
ncbi:hypothetical protein BDZ97DRAFT_1374264 [Flammula alnicola]|nr:hypothetical protein BDZ97DRAFT_1374264 [Flammula alnicola]